MSVSRPDFDGERGANAAVRAAIQVLAAGGMVVVVDDRDRENEGDLIMAAEHITDADMAFFLRYGSGIVCTPMTLERARALSLPLMVDDNTEVHQTAFTVTVDHGTVGTGISASDRAVTVRALGDPGARPTEFRRPGHVFPLVSRKGGVLKRAGHTESATDLMELAGTGGVGVITELVADDGVPMSGSVLDAFVKEFGLVRLDIADLVRFRRRTQRLTRRTGSAKLPTPWGQFQAWSYKSLVDDVEHVALTIGDLETASSSAEGALVRVHSECLTGDIFHSLRCDCGAQLEQAMELIAAEGAGALVYLRGHEGRGIGLGHKLQAYALQEHGRDTVDANLDLGLPVDSREYGIGAEILVDLGVRRIRLMTNNPHKYGGLEGYDIEVVSRVSTTPIITAENLSYLRTKRDRMGHILDLPRIAKA